MALALQSGLLFAVDVAFADPLKVAPQKVRCLRQGGNLVTGKNLILIGSIALIALALTGCGSDSSNPSPTAVVDTAPPAVPTDVSGISDISTVWLSWDANTTDADLSGYKVYRELSGRVAVLTAVEQVENSFTDTSPAQGYNTYRITAVDVNGNESAYQTVRVEVREDLDPYHPRMP